MEQLLPKIVRSIDPSIVMRKERAMSGLALCVNGLLTALLTPLLIRLIVRN